MGYNAPDLRTAAYQRLFAALRLKHVSLANLFFLDIFRRTSPAIDLPALRHSPTLKLSALDVRIFLATAFFCLVVTGALCALSGTFYSDDPVVLPFTADKWNIWLYLLVCPVYVTLCVRLMILVAEGPEAEIVTFAPPGSRQSRERLFTTLFFVLLFSLLLITNYIADAVNYEKVGRVYWFLRDIDGVRTLNMAGMYYIALNFSLLLITFLGVTSFISISFDGVALSRQLLKEPGLPFGEFRHRLTRLTKAYYYATFLVFAYVLNVLIWKQSLLGATANIYIAGALLTAMALFFVAVPRRFVQHLWAEYETRGGAQQEPEHAYRNLLSSRGSRSIDLLSTVFLGGWLQQFWGIDVDALALVAGFFQQ